MTAIETLLRQPAALAVGWALLQFVWQGAAVGALTALALVALRRSASDVRYVVAAIGLALMLTLPVVTGVQKFQSLRGETSAAAVIPSAAFTGAAGHADASRGPRVTPDPSLLSGAAGAIGSPVARVMPSARIEPLLPTLILVWIAGVSMLSLRLLTGWIWVQRLRTRGNAPAAGEWQRMATRLSRRLHIRRAITLLESTLVDVPTVIGWLKPVVLLPASALGALSPQQLEAILAHELAHIRRHDYLVNLLQTLVETLLFYHPAVWWLSRRIRIERENCCDDLAVSLCGDPVAYANALADLESLRSVTSAFRRKHHDHIAMAATGGSLLQRVRRLLGAPSSHSGRAPAWLAGSVALLLIGGIVVGADSRSQAPAAPSAPAAPPAPSAHGQSMSQHGNDSSGTWVWSNNGEKLQVSYSGTFEFSDDDTDVRQLSPGGYLKISDGAWFGRHSVEVRERDGKVDRRYYVNGSERPYDPDGRAWLRDNLPKFVRNTGIGAPARVARFLKSAGVTAVTGEIARIEGAYVKGIYFRELIKQATLTPEQYRQVMQQASREMKSDYELASLLITIADRLPNDETSRDAYFTAASGISSDYELRRVYSTMLKRGPVSPQTLAGILEHSITIGSDYEQSELLRQIMSQQILDEKTRAAFFKAFMTIESDYERHRVLKSVVDRFPDPATLEAALTQAGSMTSDYEAGTFLHEVLKQSGVEGPLRAPFFKVVSGMSSGYEKGRVLQAAVKKIGVSNDTLREVLRSTRGMSGYELSQLLQAVAAVRTLTGDLREAYLDAADRLSGYEQGQVLTALVKSERRK
jgi:beta-lactamase regulating signal transducer with metallopeptidase domain